MFARQPAESVLFITLDSCRYDTFAAAATPHLKAVGPLYQAQAPGNFTYASHAAMFVGFTPGIAGRAESFINPKFGKIFKMTNGGFSGKGTEYMTLQGRSIIDGFKRRGYLTLGAGAAGWFDPETATGRNLSLDFDRFYYPGDTYSLGKQLDWLAEQMADAQNRPLLVFLNVGETHVPYYFEGAGWSPKENPCLPFGSNNDAEKCRVRQKACLEFVDRTLASLLEAFQDSTTLVCADHGDCWGEDGLWEHGISHEKVLEVPLLFRLAPRPTGQTETVAAPVQEAPTKDEYTTHLESEYARLQEWAQGLEEYARQLEGQLQEASTGPAGKASATLGKAVSKVSGLLARDKKA